MTAGEETTTDSIPPEEQRCKASGGGGWRCKQSKPQNSRFCENHNTRFLTPNTQELQFQFTEGQQIEVSHKDESLKNAWFTAKIIKIPPNTRRTRKMLIQYENGVDPLRENVDTSQVRPLPPPQQIKSFHLHQIVDVFHENGWWKGEIVEILMNDRYIVSFKEWGNKGNFGGDEIRVHHDWVAGKWVVPHHKATDVINVNIVTDLDQRKRKIQSIVSPCRKMHKEDASEGSMSEDSQSTMPVRTRNKSSTFVNVVVRDFTQMVDVPVSQVETFIQEGDVPAYVQTECQSEAAGIDINGERVPHSNQVASQSIAITTGEASIYVTEEVVDIAQSKGTDTEIMNYNEDVQKDDRVASMGEGEEEEPEVKLPFRKSYPLWKTLETMQVFKSMPQQPHFRPLTQENEYIMEGEAIGYMLSFLAAVEKTRKFKFDEPECTIVDTLRAVTDLEALGFDVRLIRTRLEKLLSIKTELLQYDVEMKQVEEEFIKEKLENEVVELNFKEMTVKMRELQESSVVMMKKRDIILMKKQVNDSEIRELQRSIQEITEEMQDINQKFTYAAASPWS